MKTYLLSYKKLFVIYMSAILTFLMVVNIPVEALAATTSVQVETDKAFVNEIYKALFAHKGEFVVEYEKEVTEILGVENRSQVTNQLLSAYVTKMLNKAYSKDKDSSSDYDYLRWSVLSYSWSLNYNSLTMYPTIRFQVKYNETASQLKKVNGKVKTVLDSLAIEEVSDYKKVKLIHDYLVKNAEYNTKGIGFSAYAALIQKKSVCQGYSLAMYKMLTEAGIPCRIITGLGNGGAHAWNIVKLGGVWYNVDVTWDDPIGGTKTSYDYFLKGTKTFYKDHTPDASYTTSSFKKAFPLSGSNYK